MAGRDKAGWDGAFEVVGNLMATLDHWLIPVGWMFGLMFFGFGLVPVFTNGGGEVRLLALGIALLALSRASAAATYARRHRCRCGEGEARPGASAAGGEAAASEKPR